MADPSYLAEGTLTEGEAWVAIETTTLGAKAVNIGFTSGTGTKNWSQYEHLVLISSTRTDTGSNTDYVRLMLNGPSVAASGTYDDQWMGVKNGTVPNMIDMIKEFGGTDEYGTDYAFFAKKVLPSIHRNQILIGLRGLTLMRYLHHPTLICLLEKK